MRMQRRWWTMGDVRVLRKLYGQAPTVEIARRLDRSIVAITEYARRLGLGRTHHRTAHYEATIRCMHAAGHCDAEIAIRLSLTREAVCYHRRRLGLPSNANNDRHRKRVAAKTRRQCLENGAASLVEIRWFSHKVAAMMRGWPDATTPRQCDVLDLLAARGPLFRRQLQDALALGLAVDAPSPARQRPWISELIRSLRRLDLVVSLGRRHAPGGRGRNCCLYALAPGVQRKVKGPRAECNGAGALFEGVAEVPK